MQYMYENPMFLEYLRYNPRWYKILHYDPSMINQFIAEAKQNMKIRTVDKLETISNRLSLLSSLGSYFNKK